MICNDTLIYSLNIDFYLIFLFDFRSPNIYSAMLVRLYYPTHVRGATYLIGIILGYHIYYMDDKIQAERNSVSDESRSILSRKTKRKLE